MILQKNEAQLIGVGMNPVVNSNAFVMQLVILVVLLSCNLWQGTCVPDPIILNFLITPGPCCHHKDFWNIFPKWSTVINILYSFH